jgi:hypothetical protein
MKLLEITNSPDLRIDREAGVIHGVKILGSTSLNGRIYSSKAMREAASMYEGIDVNIDHPSRKDPDAERGLVDGFGCLKQVNVREDGVYGDLHYLKSHEHAEVILERAEQMPQRFGLSHNADGHTSRKGGTEVVESIERVRSVDLVRNPATVNNLFESQKENQTMKKRPLLEVIRHALPFGRSRILEQEGLAIGETPVAELPVEVAAEAPADEQIKAAFRAMVVAAFDDDSLDAKATLSKIKDIMKAQEKLMESPATNEAPVEAPAEAAAAVAESHKQKADPRLDKLVESVTTLAQRDTVRDVLDGFGIGLYDLSPENRNLLEGQQDEASMKSLIQSWPPAARRPRTGPPRSHRPMYESVETVKVPEGAEALANAIR